MQIVHEPTGIVISTILFRGSFRNTTCGAPCGDQAARYSAKSIFRDHGYQKDFVNQSSCLAPRGSHCSPLPRTSLSAGSATAT
jgi:hypothetical protein